MAPAAAEFQYRNPVKVVIINTQYVETDAMSFKSVVQRLTGKDSKIETDPSAFHSTPSSAGFYNSSAAASAFNYTTTDHQQQQLPKIGGAPTHVPVMGRGLSFKDFDRMIKELPPLEELFRLCAE